MKNLSAKFLVSFFIFSILISHQNSRSMDLGSINNQFTGGSAMVMFTELVQNELKSRDPKMRIRAIKTIVLIVALYVGFLFFEKIGSSNSFHELDKNNAFFKDFLTILSIVSKIAILKLHRDEHENIVGANAVQKHIKKRKTRGLQDSDDSYPEAEELVPDNATYQTHETNDDKKNNNNLDNLEIVPHSPESNTEVFV